MRKEGQDPSDREQRNRMVKRVTQYLRGLRIKGETVSGYNEQGYFVREPAS